MANRILIDTGFWYAFFDKKDCHKNEAEDIANRYFDSPAYEILIPFPTMYELLRTKFVKNKTALAEIKQLFLNGHITKINDDRYRELALDLTLSEDKRNLSLVDNIIRLMLDDKDVGVKGLVTFNVGDFQDVCLKNSVEILY